MRRVCEILISAEIQKAGTVDFLVRFITSRFIEKFFAHVKTYKL